MWTATLVNTPLSFKLNALGGANFKLGFIELYFGYSLSVNETEFYDLPEFKDKSEVPEVGHSIVETHNGPNTMRIDFLLFLKGERTTVSIELNLRSG